MWWGQTITLIKSNMGEYLSDLEVRKNLKKKKNPEAKVIWEKLRIFKTKERHHGKRNKWQRRYLCLKPIKKQLKEMPAN